MPDPEPRLWAAIDPQGLGPAKYDAGLLPCGKSDHHLQREHPKQPLIGVGALIVENGRVVLIKRGKAPLLGEWSIPGGMLELGETLRQGAEREALEETGLVVRATELLGVFDRIVPDAEGNIVYHYVLIDFLCQP